MIDQSFIITSSKSTIREVFFEFVGLAPSAYGTWSFRWRESNALAW